MIGSDALHAQERRALVDLLRAKGIRDELVLQAVAAVPRHLFVEDVFVRRAYEDTALPIACQQTISQPYTVAFMTELLGVRPGDKVLEVGTGSGYQAAVLAAMGARVFTIERHFSLLQQARRRFDTLKLSIASMVGDGSVGWSQFAPFERIVVTAGAPDVPPSLLRQMAEGGVLVIPVGDDSVQTMRRVIFSGGRHQVTDVQGFKFVPLIGKEGWQGK